MSKQEALSAIKAAKLPPATYRAARELLDVAHDDNGFVRLSMIELGELTGVATDGAARRHLSDLQAAKIIHYSVNGDCHITFEAFAARRIGSPMIENCAPVIQNGSSFDESPAPPDTPQKAVRAESDHPRADSDHGRSESDHDLTRGDLVGGLVDPSNPGRGDTNPPTHHQDAPARDPDPPPPDAAIERTVDLLIAVGVSDPKARALASVCDLDEALRQIAAWLPAYDAGSVQVGALISRIDQRKPAPPIPAAFRQHRLYREYAPRDVEFYPTTESRVTSPIPVERPPDLSEPWKVVQWEARHSRLSLEYTEPLQSATLAAAGDVDGVPLYQVILPAGSDRATLENRMGVWVRKTLSTLLKHKCLVEFVLLPD